MKTKVFNLIIIVGLFNQALLAQDVQLTSKDSIVQSSWIIGLGINIVDDSGDAFGNLFEVENQWNMVSFPSRLSIGKYFKNGLGVEAIGTYNKYKVGKLIDGDINDSEKDYLGLDARLSYDLNKIIGQTGWFDPYVGIGAGYTDANNNPRGTYNAIIGFRTWFSNRLGLDFSSSGKWSMGTGATNHIQHAAGLIYQFEIEKGLSEKGMEKLALMKELEKEQQRVQDSINGAREAEKLANELAERLLREKEGAKLAAEEKAKLEAEKQKREMIEQKIKDLGLVYFNLNSSYITNAYMKVLDGLVVIMEEYPTLNMKITSHTDARGSEGYNQWLSDRRLNKTLDYIIGRGIDSERISSEAYGEQQLTNDCDDGVYCSEAKHKLNRRSEFKILWN
ncbi:outer membrane protein OmpA-like peptidoglycan-associated protein/opacity protein-like surface antigen [Saonia flava]|uniref:Outer membrane protein OmpA-like peptidoglycan-associated protein/opacity protein-like surface antigen n=1 Tax=Saonia flava TaxID=523696 RepID=A0A846QQB9_9FLAO|nr:OmpA family protein [Saonia flava]NJB70301.1 outer membrane protein OmpA-like peptidoglycan-associated protein/opacity protein-like surface antigen [Saonia flava]